MSDIKVISADLDGRELREEKVHSKYFTRCSGKNDQDIINDAMAGETGNHFTLPEGAWERIFGVKDNGK